MHPEVIRDGPGSCPICGMDLIKKEENAVALKAIQIGDLLQPSNQFVVFYSGYQSSKQKKSCQYRHWDLLPMIPGESI